MIREIEIRPLRAGDVPAAVELSSSAGWNQTAADWSMLLQLDPEGCLGLECDGQLAATTTLICYGGRLAWIGMVLTHPQYRRRGFARQLIERVIQLADKRRIPTLKLDATDQGRPLYESLGFRAEQEIQRWSATAPSTGEGSAMDAVPWVELAELDCEAFGVGRGPLLHLLSQQAAPVAKRDGYIFSRPGANATFVGPCVARTSSAAQALVLSVLAVPEPRWFWDLLPSNTHAVALATGLGFRVERRLLRMERGEALRRNDTLVYAAAGFELG